MKKWILILVGIPLAVAASFIVVSIWSYVAEPDLHTATRIGNTAEVKRLIDGGADVNVDISIEGTPLHIAAHFGYTEIALALVNAGADINSKDSFRSETPLHVAAWRGNIETALALIKEGADIKAKDIFGETPLDSAIDKHGEDSDIAIALKNATQ